MRKRIRILMLLVSLSLTLSMISNTYSRYVADTSGNVDLSLARWQILVNDNDIVTNSSSSIDFSPVIEENTNISNNVLAPTSTGYFDIEMDPTNVDLSFRYTITLDALSAEVPDLMVNKYEILSSDNLVSNPLNITDINGGTIENTMIFNKSIENYKHDKFVIRVYFEWYDDANASMSDEEDTSIGHRAATENLTVDIKASVNFTQVII